LNFDKAVAGVKKELEDGSRQNVVPVSKKTVGETESDVQTKLPS
jgi:hypothetical protein